MEKENKSDLKYIDKQSTEKMIDTLHSEITKAVKGLKHSNKEISDAVDLISKSILDGGKLYIYGCGTTARVAIVENLELQSFFSINPEIIQSNIFGNERALKSIKAEPRDCENSGRAEIVLSFVKDVDVLIILTTKYNQKYSLGALTVADQKNIPTILISQDEKYNEFADINIVIPNKSKKIASIYDTFSSTLYKTVLNLIFTGVMTKLGKVYNNNIIDPNAERHKDEIINIVKKYAQTDEETAIKTLEQCKYHPKVAIVMLKNGVSLKTAVNLIKKKQGRIHSFVE